MEQLIDDRIINQNQNICQELRTNSYQYINYILNKFQYKVNSREHYELVNIFNHGYMDDISIKLFFMSLKKNKSYEECIKHLRIPNKSRFYNRNIIGQLMFLIYYNKKKILTPIIIICIAYYLFK
jgi:hypothetical protein